MYNSEEQFPKNSIFVIDEASMIDIEMFAALLEAIPEGARIFILGDPFQLPSVDSGAVLGEILKVQSFRRRPRRNPESAIRQGFFRQAQRIQPI